MNKCNRTWIAFANKKRCRHADAINTLGFISWRMGRARFAIGNIVESDLLQYGFKGGKSLEIPNCNNMELIKYIKSVF